MENYYHNLLAAENNFGENAKQQLGVNSNGDNKESTLNSACVVEKWRGQIEKVIPIILL